MKVVITVVVSIFLLQDNHPPVVKIDAPSTVSAGSALRYTINVSDKEDGDTKYDDINPNEILLQVQPENGKK